MAGGRAPCCRSWARRSWPASPTSIPATSPPTSRPGRSSATCCCGSSSPNMTAMLVQALSAKLGIATGRNLAEMCRDRFPRPVVWGMWGVSELVAMATDLAEFLRAALRLYLLLHLPLLVAAVLTGVVTLVILALERYGFRPVEAVITGFVGIIALSYVVETILDRPDWGAVAAAAGVPP